MKPQSQFPPHGACCNARAALLGAGLLAATACGSAATPVVAASSGSSASPAKSVSTVGIPESVPSNLTNDRPKSVFSSIGKDAHDPFFPGSIRFQEKIASAFGGSSATNSVPIDVVALLSDGFQGVFRTDLDRLALVNNTIIEPGKNAEILVGPSGNQQRIKVHCLEITRNTVVITVPGHAEPVVLTLKIKGIAR
jgi:hypothetical protein